MCFPQLLPWRRAQAICFVKESRYPLCVACARGCCSCHHEVWNPFTLSPGASWEPGRQRTYCALGLSPPDSAWIGPGPYIPGTGLGRSVTPMAALCPGSLGWRQLSCNLLLRSEVQPRQTAVNVYLVIHRQEEGRQIPAL